MHPVIFWWLVVGTGFPFVHGVVWLRQTQRMMTMMRKTRSQCSCCLRRLALLGLPRGSPGVQRKQVIRMIWRLSCSPTMLTLFKRSWHWRSFCSRRQWQIWIEDHLQKRPLNCSATSLQRLIWGKNYTSVDPKQFTVSKFRLKPVTLISEYFCSRCGHTQHPPPTWRETTGDNGRQDHFRAQEGGHTNQHPPPT